MIGTEADGDHAIAEALAAEMADIVLATREHFSRCRVADVGIMGPHDGFACGAAKGEQILKRFEHVIVAQIP